jgi:hypothetical protein
MDAQAHGFGGVGLPARYLVTVLHRLRPGTLWGAAGYYAQNDQI